MNREDETPIERPIIEVTEEKVEHLCYLQADTDAVRVWRDGTAEACALCRAHVDVQR